MQTIFENFGLIFDASHNLPSHLSYAQSPQVLKFGNLNRVYFSSRCLDSLGKPVSLVNYVDFDERFEKTLGLSKHPIVETSDLGTFDEHGIFPFHPRYLNGEVIAFSTGWSRRSSVAIETSIGLLKGNSDGSKFLRIGEGPVLGASLNEPFLVGDAFILENPDSTYFMYYIAGTSWKNNPEKSQQPERNYKIRLATSTDLIHWEPFGRNLVPNILGEEECQALPSVIRIEDEILMVFCYRETFDFRYNPRNAYRLGFAKSKDGFIWERVDQMFRINSHDSGWDQEMRCYPHIFYIEDRLALLYNGNKFGRNGFGLAIQEL